MASGETASANVVSMMLSRPVTADEFAAAKTAVLDARRKFAVDEAWLDADTFKQASAADVQKVFDAATIGDVQLLAESLAKNPIVSVVLAPAEKPASN